MRRRSLALAGPPKSAKNRGGGALIQDSALNRANTVMVNEILYICLNDRYRFII